MVPADGPALRNELTACLALVAATGMDLPARAEWLRVAGISLAGIPADLLSIGCAEARRTCDHPSKIVPAIMRAIAELWRARRQAASNDRRPCAPSLAKPDYVTPAEAAAILVEFGLKRAPA